MAGTAAYMVVNGAGELTGLFVSKAADGAAAVAGGVATVLAGSVAGTITQKVMRGAADGWFVPAVRSGGRLGALGAAAGVGAVTVLAVTLAYHGGSYVIDKIQTLRGSKGSNDSETIEFSVEDDTSGEFAVISIGDGGAGCGGGPQ